VQSAPASYLSTNLNNLKKASTISIQRKPNSHSIQQRKKRNSPTDSSQWPDSCHPIIEFVDQSMHLTSLPTCTLSRISSGDPFTIESMPPERAFLVIGTVFPFTVNTATEMWTNETICSGGYQLGLHIQITLAATTVRTMIVPRVGTRTLKTIWSTC
jgi:hypothetical protein